MSRKLLSRFSRAAHSSTYGRQPIAPRALKIAAAAAVEALEQRLVMAATGILLDTLIITESGAADTTNFSLVPGHVYALVADGDLVIHTGQGRHSDADWFEPTGGGARQDITGASLDEGVKPIAITESSNGTGER
jgi:hypothetical protein